ncbi:MAG: DUF4178 domain-containing protein [Caldimonas sp.]
MASTEPSPQRAYRAACPNCGAPVEFRSAASPFAVCGFCRSTVVRAGDQLRKIGESAELFDDHTPLQLGVSGSYQGAPFTLVGRLQYRTPEGTWNEWHAIFESGPGSQKSGWLSEDNGRYVVAFDAPLTTPVPPPEQLRVGAPLTVSGQSWTVASVVAAKLIAAAGELPKRPDLQHGFAVADLRSSRGEVGTIDYGDPARPEWSVGRTVVLSELALRGLREESEKALGGRTLQCPSCGTALTVKLATTQSIVCRQCKSVIDLMSAEQGQVGADLAHYAQGNGGEPLIALGSVGTLALGSAGSLPWQVVGYVERCEIPETEDDEDEQVFWREYLLYHRTAGFAFLVDTQDGWSWTAPITGAPQPFGDSVKHDGVLYRKLYDYVGKVTYVLGEFYWRLERDERTANTDYAGTGTAAAKRLNREQTEGEGSREVVWSAGETLAADTVIGAFRLAADKRAALQRDALPTTFKGGTLAKIFFWFFVASIVAILLGRCGGGGAAADCTETRKTFGEASQEYQNCLNNQRSRGGFRSGGGSFGGFSSGGGHK